MGKLLKILSIFLSSFLLISVLFSSGSLALDQSMASKVSYTATDGIIVKYKNSFSKDKVKVRESKALKNRLKKEIPAFNMDVFELDSFNNMNEVMEEIRGYPDVEYVQPDYKLYSYGVPDDPDYSIQWGLRNNGQTIGGTAGVSGIDINAAPVWDYTKGDDNLIVAVVDTGIDISHIEIKDSIFINSGEVPSDGIDNDRNGYIDDVNGWNFYDNNNQLYDPAASDWHGTGIAGIIAGGWNNGIGISGLVPKVKLLPVKYLGGTKGEAKTSGAIMAIEYAKKMGAKVINCSWGGPGYNAALEEVIVKSPDILFVCASGNDKLDTDRYPVYPACLNLPNTISVAAVNNTGVEAGFSNYGSKIDVAAPGNYIYSTYPGNAFVYVNGTSFAAPYVSGVAALLRSYRPDITSEELKGSIKSSVKILSSLKQVVNTSGMVDAFGALRYANNWGETPPSPIPTPVYSSTPVPTPYVPGIVGDVSGDGQVNSTDYTLMKRYLLGIISDFPVEDDLWAADVNNDSLINSTDLTLMKRFLLGIISKFPK